MPAHRLRGRAVHARRATSSRAGAPVAVRAAQAACPREPEPGRRPDRPPRRHDRRVPPRPGRGRRAGAAGVRLVGRRARSVRLRGVRRAAHAPAVRRAGGLGVPTIHFGTGNRGPARARWREAGGDVHRRRLANPARPRRGAVGSPDRGGPGQPRPGASCSDRGTPPRPARGVLDEAAGRARPRLQPRPRRAAADRPGPAAPAGRPRPRVAGAAYESGRASRTGAAREGRERLRAACRRRTRRRDAGLVHAPGRRLAAAATSTLRASATRSIEIAQHARAVRRGHADAGRRARGRRRGDVRRHHAAARGDGRRARADRRVGPGHRPPDPLARRRRAPAAGRCRERTSAFMLEAIRHGARASSAAGPR